MTVNDKYKNKVYLYNFIINIITFLFLFYTSKIYYSNKSNYIP